MADNRRREKIRVLVHNSAKEAEHFHQDIELLYIMEGSLDVKVGEQMTHMFPEDILVINANKMHTLKGSEDILYAQLLIEYNMVSDLFDSMNIIFWCNSTKDESERYDKLRAAIKELLNHHLSTRGNSASFAHISLCYRVLDLLSGYFLVQTADKELMDDGDKFDERIDQINNYIRANYSQPISLKELADKLYLSNGYLSRFFKKNYGMNFAEYLTNIRLFHAVDELMYTNTPITMIAYDNGFASVAVFNKAFKKAYGETPSALRKRLKEQKEEPKQQTEDTVIEERLEQYLITSQTEKKEVNQVEQQENSHSVKNTEQMKNWGRTLNVGMASDLLKSEIQEHVMLLKESLDFEYARFCNPFTREMLLDPEKSEGHYNFSRIDTILDFLIRFGIKPHIEMGPKPRMITYNVQKVEVEGTRNVEFANVKEWEELLEALFRHLTQRYGRSALDFWRIELWFNENKWDDPESMVVYFDLFRTLKSTVKKYNSKIEVGGCGIRLDNSEQSRIVFYQNWMKQASKPDFISMIIFPYDRGVDGQDHYAKRCTDNECLKHRVESERELLRITGFENTTLYVTEWNMTISARNFINDSCFKGAYIIKNLLDVYGIADDLAYWLGSDRNSEYYDSNELVNGGTGLMTKDGILKPAGFAFEFMKRLYSNCAGKGENYLISTDGADSYGIVCHNQRTLGYNYYFTKEDELEKEHLWKYYEDRDELDLKLELRDVADGRYKIKMYRINEQNGSVLNIWQELDFEPELSRNDIKYFRRMCEPRLIIQKTEAKDHTLKLNILMQANEIVFVRVRRLP